MDWGIGGRGRGKRGRGVMHKLSAWASVGF